MANKAYPPSICPGIPRLGKCPKGWTTCTFGDVLTVVERLVPIADESVYQLVTAKRNRGGIVPREQLKGKEIKTQGQYTVRKGDFLIGNRQIIHGACGIVPETLDGAIVSGEYTVLLPKKGLWLPWLAYFAHTVHFQQTCFQSSIGVDVEKMVFKVDWWLKQLLHIPPIAEQKHIVEILATWDDANSLVRMRISLARKQRNALSQRLLTKGIPRIAMGRWQKKTLLEMGELIRGVSYDPASDLPDGESTQTIRLLRANNVNNDTVNTVDPIIVNALRVSPEQLLRKNDIVVCMSSGSKNLVGKAAVFKEADDLRYTVGAFMAIYRPYQDSTSPLVPWLFQSAVYRYNISLLLAGTNINNLRTQEVSALCFLIPVDDSECSQIADFLSTAATEIEALEANLTALERQKLGLMQQLLTGKLRVRTTNKESKNESV